MPLRLEEVGGRQMWLLVCGECGVEGEHTETFEQAREEGSWHVADDPTWDSELEGYIVLCDICYHLDTQTGGPILHFEVRDAIIEHLRTLPGGQDLDFGSGSLVRSVVDALAMGGIQEDLEARLLNLSGSAQIDLGNIRSAMRSVDGRTRFVQRFTQPVPGIALNVGRPAPSPESDSSTVVFFNLDRCELPDWVYVGAWVRRLTDQCDARVNYVGDVNVTLAIDNTTVYWRRKSNAHFDSDFEPLPPALSRYERLMGEETIGINSAAVGW